MSASPVVIAGAGMTGLIAALVLRKRHPDLPISIIEPSAEAGGNYRCVHTAHGIFDQGMRLYYDTGIAEIDDLVEGALPAGAWHIYPDNAKDIAGIFWNGRLQANSPYLDLRGLPAQERAQYEAEIVQAASMPAPAVMAHGMTASQALAHQFGPALAQRFEPILRKLYDLPAQALSAYALHQPAMNRVVLYDEGEMPRILASDALRARIAWPNQMTLPPALRHFRQRALYPKRYGMDTLIAALRARLEASGVQFLFGQSVRALSVTQGRITGLETSAGAHFSPGHVIWTGGLPPLSRLVHDAAPMRMRENGKAYMVHLRLRDAPVMGSLYHFYCFDEGMRSFRVTNYSAYCPAAQDRFGYPVCVELWTEQGQPDDVVQRIAADELLAMGIAPDRDGISYCGVTPTANLHAQYSSEGIAHIRAARDAIHDAAIANLTYAGVFASNSALLLYEVLQDLHARLGRVEF